MLSLGATSTLFFYKNQIILPRLDVPNFVIILDSNVLKIAPILWVIVANVWKNSCCIEFLKLSAGLLSKIMQWLVTFMNSLIRIYFQKRLDRWVLVKITFWNLKITFLVLFEFVIWGWACSSSYFVCMLSLSVIIKCVLIKKQTLYVIPSGYYI